MRHFEDDGMKEVRRREPANHPMRLLFVKRLVRSICKTFNAPGLPLALTSAQCQGPGTHPEYSLKPPGDYLDPDPQGKTSRGKPSDKKKSILRKTVNFRRGGDDVVPVNAREPMWGPSRAGTTR
jgi:hypothetical protein